MKPQFVLIVLLIIIQGAYLSTAEEDNNYPPPPDNREYNPSSNENNYPPPPENGGHQAPHSNENNYPPPQYNKPSHSPNDKNSKGSQTSNRDVKIDSKSYNNHRGIDESIGEREYTTRYRTYDRSYDSYYNSNSHPFSISTPQSLLILLMIGLVVIYISIILMFYTESSQVSHFNLLKWLKQNQPQLNKEELIPTNQLIACEDQLNCSKNTSSFSILNLPETAIRVKVIQESFEKIETTEKVGDEVIVKTKFIWSSPKEIVNITNDVLFCNHKISQDAFNILTSICDEYMALPELNQINQFMQEHKQFAQFTNRKEGYYYSNQDLSQPMLNDKRIRVFYRKTEPNVQYSFIGSFNGLLFEPYLTPIKKGSLNLLCCCCNVYNACYSISHFSKGPYDFQKYIQMEEKRSTNSTILMRLIGLVIYAIGTFLLMLPLYQLISMTPLIGPQLCYVAIIIGLMASIMGFLSIFAIAWFNARPQLSMIIGIIMLIVSMFFSAKVNNSNLNYVRGAEAVSMSLKEAIYEVLKYYFK